MFVTPNLAHLTGNQSYGPFKPRIIDGDTLSNGTDRFRLVGIDACEMGQPIQFPEHDKDLNCGYFARAFIEDFIGTHKVVCFGNGERSYGRIVARCFIDDGWPKARNDIGVFALYSGWAVPTEHAGSLFKMRYLVEYTLARISRRGAWNGSSVHPSIWRAHTRMSKGG